MKKICIPIITCIVILICYLTNTSIAETSTSSVTGTSSGSVADLREQRKLAQEEISQNTVKLDELQVQITDLMKEIQDLSDEIYKYEIDVAVLDKEIEQLDAEILKVQIEFTKAEKKYLHQRDLLSKRIVAQYEEGEVGYLDFLLNSKGLAEFISNCYLIEEIAQYDNDLLNSYKVQKEKVDKTKKELDEYKAELRAKKEEQEKSAIVLSNIKVVKNNQMSSLTEEQRTLQEEIDEYQKQVQEIEIELLMILTENLGSEYVGGALAWPVPGYTTITSPFGMREHPISKVYKLHAGVDIGAPLGAYFVAANDGIVVTSKYSLSYGNMVVIDHGGGLSTLYAHGTERLVEVGDKVKRGEPVLTVGSTGISTGPHAHFEVRINGRCVDPLEYILKNNSKNETREEQNNE